jgi:hypothetical protein
MQVDVLSSEGEVREVLDFVKDNAARLLGVDEPQVGFPGGAVHAVLRCAVLCCAVLCCAVLCCAVLCCAVLCCAVLCCAVGSSPLREGIG